MKYDTLTWLLFGGSIRSKGTGIVRRLAEDRETLECFSENSNTWCFSEYQLEWCTPDAHTCVGTLTKFQQQLEEGGACPAARRWVFRKTAREAWEQCDHVFWMRWLVYGYLEYLPGVAQARTSNQLRKYVPFHSLREWSRREAKQ